MYSICAQILLTVAVSTVSIFLPKTVVAQITSKSSVQQLIFTVFAFTAATTILQALKNYFDDTAQPRRTGLRIKVCTDILNKHISTDYANLEDKKFTDAKQKANENTYNNYASTERIYYCFANLGASLLGFLVYTTLLVSVNPIILLITAATTIFGVLVRRWANKWQYEHDEESARYNKRLWYINNVSSNYAMAKDIRLFAISNWLKDVYQTNLKLADDLNRRVQIRQLLADAVDCMATFIREGIAYGFLIWQVLYMGLPVDSFVLLFAAIGGFSGWIMGILNEYTSLSKHSNNYCRIREYLEFPDAFKYDEGEAISPENNKAYTLELKNVSFRYIGADENTLENINIVIKPGERLAVVGLNGAGKTTLVKLLCGFYDPTEGAVLLNGRDIRVFNRRQYYSLFTAVFQEFNILPQTISENISQQYVDETDQERLGRCLELADIDKRINALPLGPSSLLIKSVNEDAVELSGGETQRLMLARALYKDAPILILDEPTAALDPIAESKLYDHYNELSAGKTSIYISHRLASTRFCDRILLIDKKGIAECGTHDELLSLGGKYAELYEIQSKYYREGVEEAS